MFKSHPYITDHFHIISLVIQVEAIGQATEPIDMRAGPDTALARVIQVGELHRTLTPLIALNIDPAITGCLYSQQVFSGLLVGQATMQLPPEIGSLFNAINTSDPTRT